MRVSAQKNKFWVHQIDIKKGTVSPPAGTSESSKTGYTTYDTKESIKENVLYVKNDIMNSQESQEGEDDFTGFNEPDVSEDGVTYESRLLHNVESTPAGTSESSKTGYPTFDTTVIISSDEFVVNKNVTDDMSEDDFIGFNEPDVNEDGVTYESRFFDKLSTINIAKVLVTTRLNGAAVLYDITDIKNIKITESSFTMADKNPQRRKNDSANNSLPQNTNGVKNDSSVSESHSIAIPFSDEFKANKRKRYAEGVAEKYGGSIDQARVEGYIGVCLTSRQRNQ